MTSDEKLDKLVEDVAVIRTLVQQHADDIDSLKIQVAPVVQHVASLRFLAKLVGALIGVGTLIVSIIALVKS